MESSLSQAFPLSKLHFLFTAEESTKSVHNVTHMAMWAADMDAPTKKKHRPNQASAEGKHLWKDGGVIKIYLISTEKNHMDVVYNVGQGEVASVACDIKKKIYSQFAELAKEHYQPAALSLKFANKTDPITKSAAQEPKPNALPNVAQLPVRNAARDIESSLKSVQNMYKFKNGLTEEKEAIEQEIAQIDESIYALSFSSQHHNTAFIFLEIFSYFLELFLSQKSRTMVT